jgi:predicted XRE-type DNA-binding protein
MKKVKLTRSSGNVFRDLGFSGDEAEYLKVRAELMLNLQKVITARRLKQAKAAELLGVTQPRVRARYETSGPDPIAFSNGWEGSCSSSPRERDRGAGGQPPGRRD